MNKIRGLSGLSTEAEILLQRVLVDGKTQQQTETQNGKRENIVREN